jgi:hypothetical protein
MRQVWVHGDYMKAIELRVLQQALYVQNALIGPGFDDDQIHTLALETELQVYPNSCIPSFKRASWGFHSPLMYWDCSSTMLDADSDLLATINRKMEQQSFLNFTLRPSSVFAGKAFVKGKLQAADALVITLFDKTGATLGEIWESRSKALANSLSPEWSMFPDDGHIARSRLYVFRFKPMTLYDDLTLAAIYFLMAAYVLYKLGDIRAIKSKVGLVITILFKMTVSILASFTVCSFLGVNLTRIPREVFPFVVIVFGLGNIFRLINEVLATPPEIPPIQRISHAIGEVGHLSLAMAFQNLVILYLLSRLVNPWVAQFCAFAAVTLVFDFVFHITFFLAVLSVEVQRMELQDSLQRVNIIQQSGKNIKQGRPTWLGAMRQGRLPFSTRLAGSAAIVSFIFALNWHFFDTTSQAFSLRRLLHKLLANQHRTPNTPMWTPPPINQARLPAEWLSLQDPDTAKEFIAFVKPGAHSFVARVYDPLLIFLNGAEGRKGTQRSESFFELIRHLARDHAFPACLIVVFTIAGVTLLMNYLLWNGAPEDAENNVNEEASLSIKNLPIPHTLDVASLTSCAKGHLVSIGLDRSTSIWFYEQGKGYVHTLLQTATMTPRLWPIVSSTMDDGGSLLALCTDGGQIGLWSLTGRRYIHFPTVELRGQIPLLFSFASVAGEQDGPWLFIVTPDGYLTEIECRKGTKCTRKICLNTITCASLFTSAKRDTKLVYASASGEVHMVPWKESPTMTPKNDARVYPPDSAAGSKISKIKSIFVVSSLRLLFVVRKGEVDVVNLQTRTRIHTVQTGQVKANSLRVIHSAHRQCSCGAPAVHALSLVYTESHTDHMIMQTFTIDDTANSQICFSKDLDGSKHRCQGLDTAVEAVYSVARAGVWETTHAQLVIGLRKCATVPTPSSSSTSGVDLASAPSTVLKLRARAKLVAQRLSTAHGASGVAAMKADNYPDSEDWEVWSMTCSGEFHSRPLIADADEANAERQNGVEDHLFVASPGPIARLGKHSVAVGFGNRVKIITLGKEWFEGGADDYQEPSIASYKLRGRRAMGRKLQ